ncbi:MAG: cytosolic protein [Anaerolineae bacterium]
MNDQVTSQDSYDSPWKEVLETYTREFTAFFFPNAHDDIDWDRGYEFLDKELQQVTRDASLGPRQADKLVKVWRQGGDEAWVLMHIEIQSQGETGFAERMYGYNHRLYDRYHRQVASLAVLGDESRSWRPNHFGYDLWGCRLSFGFPVAKLLDYRDRWQELETSVNPFAIVVMAHLKAQETRHDYMERSNWKVLLIRRLYRAGYTRQDVINLFRFIDWIMRLPDDLDDTVWQEVQRYEEANDMEYVTSVERIGMRKGRQQGLEQGLEQGIEQGKREGLWTAIQLGLDLRFGAPGMALLPEIYKIEDVDVLKTITDAIKTAKNPEELRGIYQVLPS